MVPNIALCGRYLPAGQVNRDRLVEEDEDIAVASEKQSDRIRDIGRRKTCSRNLIK